MRQHAAAYSALTDLCRLLQCLMLFNGVPKVPECDSSLPHDAVDLILCQLPGKQGVQAQGCDELCAPQLTCVTQT